MHFYRKMLQLWEQGLQSHPYPCWQWGCVLEECSHNSVSKGRISASCSQAIHCSMLPFLLCELVPGLGTSSSEHPKGLQGHCP